MNRKSETRAKIDEVKKRIQKRKEDQDAFLEKIFAQTLEAQQLEKLKETNISTHTDSLTKQTTHEVKESNLQTKSRKLLTISYFMDQANFSGKLKPETIEQSTQVDSNGSDESSEMVEGSSMNEESDVVYASAFRPRPLQPLVVNQPMAEKKEFTSEELRNIMRSKDFTDFFHKTSKLIEKTLDSHEPCCFEPFFEREPFNSSEPKERLEHLISFYDAQYSANRIVTSIDWSPNLPELILASYSQNLDGNPNDPQGVALLWSMALRSRPEFSLFCQSAITASKFHPYSNSLIVGGTYGGQVIVWDLRAKQTPVQRSAMTSSGHTHPIYSLNIVGSQSANNIVSVSNDGRLCIWNMSMLSTPQKSVDLMFKSPAQQSQLPSARGLSALNPTCMAFPDEEANNFFVGGENGDFYSAQIHASQSKGENVLDAFEGHQATISSLSILPSRHDLISDVSGLVLSSSFDWTVKLWSPKFKTKPLITFESSDDYVYDIVWNRANPSLFSAVDGEGYIHLWDISKSLDAPIVKYKADSSAINKCRWNEDGTKLMTGNSAGYVKIYRVHKSLLKTSLDSIERFEASIIDLIKNDEE